LVDPFLVEVALLHHAGVESHHRCCASKNADE
jgi:hypothetical protein